MTIFDPARLVALRTDLERVRLFPDQPDQLAEIDRLREIHSHTIAGIYLKNPLIPLREFSCFAFALGLVTWRRSARLLSEPVRPIINQPFLREVLSESIEVQAPDATNGIVAVYQVDDEVVHAGLVHDGRIRSKWGNGYLWDHEAFEIPLEYGSTIRYFNVPGQKRIADILSLHAERQLAQSEQTFQATVEQMRARLRPSAD